MMKHIPCQKFNIHCYFITVKYSKLNFHEYILQQNKLEFQLQKTRCITKHNSQKLSIKRKLLKFRQKLQMRRVKNIKSNECENITFCALFHFSQ